MKCRTEAVDLRLTLSGIFLIFLFFSLRDIHFLKWCQIAEATIQMMTTKEIMYPATPML